MISQPVLPVVTPDNRILGTVQISPRVFTGDESEVEYNGTIYQVSKTSFVRPDGSVAEYMAVQVSASEERVQAHRQIKGFVPIDQAFHLNIWIQVANIVQDPDRSRSAVEAFFKAPFSI